MNKQDIISRLKDFPYSCEEYWVITGSAMVLYGIREHTHDIDMGFTSAMADKLVSDGYSYQLKIRLFIPDHEAPGKRAPPL